MKKMPKGNIEELLSEHNQKNLPIQDVPEEELKNLPKYQNHFAKKPIIMSILASLGLQFGGFFFTNKVIPSYKQPEIVTTISLDEELPKETLVPDQKIYPLELPKATGISLNKELPKVTGPNPDWYLLEKQPLEAIIREIQKTDIRVYIGNTTAKINEQEYRLDAAPYIKEGRTLVPLRFIAEGLGASVGWDGVERKVILDYEGSTIELWIGKKQARVNGVEYVLDVAPEIKSGRTFVPIRFIAENFGSKVDWNSILKEVSIIKEKEYKKIDENSDADKDGVVFKEEKNLGTNPNDKNTIYNFLTDKQLLELKRKNSELNIFKAYPDGITKLTLPEKAQLGLNPVSAFSLDQNINDEIIVNYALNKNPELKTGEELKSIWQEFNTKYSSFIEALKENLNLETITKIEQAGNLVLKFKNLGLDEKLKATISKEYISRVMSEIEEFDGIAPITASFTKEFVNANKEYFSQLKNSSLEFIASMLSKYPELTIEKQIEAKKKYQELDFSKRETFENPDRETGLTLLEKIKLNINPLNPYNFDNILNDKLAIEYTKSKNLETTKENITKTTESIIKNYGEKLGSAIKQTTKLGITQPDEIDSEAQTAKTQVENMFSERAYKKKADGTQITLEDLTSIERYKALIALNKTFASEEINILLSQSKTLQEYVNNNRVSELKELVDTLYKAANSMEEPVNQKIKELNVFKKYINQLGLFENNAGEYSVQMWLKASDSLKQEIKQHPKLFLAFVGKNRAWAEAGKVKIGTKEYDFSTVFDDIVKYSIEQLNYITKTEKYFQEKGYELYEYSGYGRQIENLPFIWMQGFMVPAQRFLETSQDKLARGRVTLKDIVADLMDVSDYDKLLKIMEERYHKVPIGTRGCVSDFLGQGIGPSAYGSKPATAAMWIDVKIRGPPERWLENYEKYEAIPEALLPYLQAQILTEAMIHLNLSAREVSQKLIMLLPKNSIMESERIPWYKTGDAMAVEKILDDVIIMPTIEKKFDIDKTVLYVIIEKNRVASIGRINHSIMQGGKIEDYGAKKDYLPLYFAVPYESNPNNPLNILLKEKNVKKGEAIWWNISFLY